MNLTSNTPGRACNQAREESQPAMQAVSPNPIQGSASGSQAALSFDLVASQHAQVTKAVFEQEQIGVAIVSVDGRIQHANRALADLLEYNQEEVDGKALEDLGTNQGWGLHPGFVTEPVSGDRRPPPVIKQLTCKSRRTVKCLIDSYPIRDNSGKATYFLVLVTDAQAKDNSEKRKAFENELYRSQALQTLGLLAGGVAHDFNNALEVILGFASLARVRLSPADPLHEPLRIITESAENAAALARQLLDVSKNSPDGEKTIDINELISAVLAIITRTFDRNIQIEHRIAPRLPCVRGIRNRLQQAILNLCINARDAMQQGGTLIIDATLGKLDQRDPRLPASNLPGHYVRIAVRDSGAGMTPEVLKHIFTPLFSTKGPSQGAGLGLAMVDRVIKEAGGFIAVTSKHGKGSEFAFYLPAVLSECRRTVPTAPGPLISGHGKVLVVDDEPRVLEFLEKGLTRLGYEVVSAESGSQACEIYSSQCEEISCVLLDLIMPGMSGLDTYARLRSINPRVKVILSSGYSSARLKREALKTGSPEFLEKPYTLEGLSQVLQKTRHN